MSLPKPPSETLSHAAQESSVSLLNFVRNPLASLVVLEGLLNVSLQGATRQNKSLTAMVLAVGLLTSQVLPLSFADSYTPADYQNAPVNSTQDNHIVQGGLYTNTAGGKTLFTNSNGNGLYLPGGNTVRGVEVTNTGAPTGNGGFLHFWAPGSVVRLDGNVNVNGVLKGGNVVVDSAYLYQNGQIFANGAGGGTVQFNVGAATFGPNAKIEALGSQNPTGKITINATDFVDFQSYASTNTLVSSTGQVLSTLNSNQISVDAGLINVEGAIRATGSYTTTGQNGGIIRLVAHGSSGNCFNCTLDTVRVVTTNVDGLPIAGDVIFTENERQTLIARRDELFNGGVSQDGNARISVNGLVVASGKNGGDGGQIAIAAANNIVNDGLIQSNGARGLDGLTPTKGGNGGSISLSAANDIINTCAIEANGGDGGHAVGQVVNQAVAFDVRFVDEDEKFNNVQTPQNWEFLGTACADESKVTAYTGANGGNGGAIGASYGRQMVNTGIVQANGGKGGNGLTASAQQILVGSLTGSQLAAARAYGANGGNGGNGGLIVFSGPQNPTGGGLVSTNGGMGGNGGDATAYAKTSSHKQAIALAEAIAGNGGQGGLAGTVVAPNPNTFTNTQNYSAKAGLEGRSGNATATAIGGATQTVGQDIQTWFGHAMANAVTGNQGTATATAKGVGVDAARSRANAETGPQGTAIANADSAGKWYAYADADGKGGDYSNVDVKSKAVADGSWDGAAIKGAFSTADAVAGYKANAKADAYARSYAFENQADYVGASNAIRNKRGSDAEALASAITQDFGNSDAKAYAEGQQFIKAVADSQAGVSGMACSDADAIQKGFEYIDPLAVAKSKVGNFGVAHADAYAKGNWDTHAIAQADSGLAGRSTALSDAYSYVNLANAESAANSGDFGRSTATSKAVSEHRNQSSKSKALAVSGYAGRSIADATSKTNNGFNRLVTADATAISGDRGFSQANSLASAGVQWDTNIADAFANSKAKTGYGGTALADAKADSATDDATATASAEYTTAGFARARSQSAAQDQSKAVSVLNGATQTQSGTGVKQSNQTVDTLASVTGPVIAPPLPPAAPGLATPQNNVIQQTQANEVIVHNGSTLLLANGGTQTSLQERLNVATVRTVQQPLGGAALNANTQQQLMVSNFSGSNLTLDQTGYNNLNHLVVNNKGAVTNTQTVSTRDSLAVIAGGNITNTSRLNSQGIVLVSHQNVVNEGDIATHSARGLNTGGSVIVKAKEDLINQGRIASNGQLTGGQVQLRAGDDLVNLGQVTANSNQTAGIIVAKAGDIHANAGLYAANASDNRGGYVHLHGNNVAINVGDLEAKGKTQGGRVLLTAGDNDQTNNNRAVVKDNELAAIFGPNNVVKGFSTRQLTPPVTTLDTTLDMAVSESAINLGRISTQSEAQGKDGRIYVAGNNQAGFGNGSTLNGVTVDVDSILAAPKPSVALQSTMSQVQSNGGHVYLVTGQAIQNSRGHTLTAVEAVACDAGPGNREPDVNPNQPKNGSEFPDDFTLPDPKNNNNGGPNYNVLGLFQERRVAEPPAPPRRIVLRLDNPDMFTASKYESTTEEIMALALDEYNRVLSTGQVLAEANRQMKLWMMESGITPSVAYTLMESACACGGNQLDNQLSNADDENRNAIKNIKHVDNREEFGRYCKFRLNENPRVENVVQGQPVVKPGESEILTQVALDEDGTTTIKQAKVDDDREPMVATSCRLNNVDTIVLKALAEISEMADEDSGRQALLTQ